MDRSTRDAMIGEELEHIPADPGPVQSDFRMIYTVARQRSLAGGTEPGKTRAEVLRYAIEQLRRSSPGADPVYDAAYFVE